MIIRCAGAGLRSCEVEQREGTMWVGGNDIMFEQAVRRVWRLLYGRVVRGRRRCGIALRCDPLGGIARGKGTGQTGTVFACIG